MEGTFTGKNKYVLWALIALELFMSFSFLGYIHIDPISITFVYIPVLAAGCLMGPKEATLVGTIFGLASMWKASAYYVGVGDMIFSPIQSGRPLESILLSVGSRALFGLISGLLYQSARRGKHPLVNMLLVSSLGRVLHSFLVYGFMGIFFPEMGFGISNTLNDIFHTDFIPSTLAVDLIIFLCYIFLRSEYVRKYIYRIETVDQVYAISDHNKRGMWTTVFLTLLAAFSVTLYFTDRIESVMHRYGIDLSDRISYDMLHLQIQFLLGILSLSFLVILVITVHQKNLNYLYYEARLDGLTGLLGRQQFFQSAQDILDGWGAEKEGETTGFFIILDIDHFKKINDQLGHPAGDRVLREAAEKLRKIFGSSGILGRLGGDEFVALIRDPMTREDMERQMGRLKEEMNAIRLPKGAVTCSMGAIPVEGGAAIDDLYRKADRLLYEAKQKGKDQFVLSGEKDTC